MAHIYSTNTNGNEIGLYQDNYSDCPYVVTVNHVPVVETDTLKDGYWYYNETIRRYL